MSTVQDISSADSLIPNGNFIQGVAYWEGEPEKTSESFRHLLFRSDHEGDPSLKDGEPKYGIQAWNNIICRLNRNDLFIYPILRYLSDVTAIPIKKNALLIRSRAGHDDDFWVEDVDWATQYEAVMNVSGLLRIVIDRETVIRKESVLAWIRPDGTTMEVVVQSEDRSDRGVDYRTFQVERRDGDPITASDTGSTPEQPFGVSVVHFVVRARPQEGTTVTLWATDNEYAGHYVISRSSDSEIVVVPEGQVLKLLAQNGDVGGLVYERVAANSTYTVRVLSGTVNVSPGDYFIAQTPVWGYGKVMSVHEISGVQTVTVSVIGGSPPPPTGGGVFRSLVTWAFAPEIRGDLEVSLLGCRYELTLAFTARMWSDWEIDLQFIEEAGESQSLAKVIDSMRFTKVRSFPVSDGSSYDRYVYLLKTDRPLPVGGIPRLKFTRPTSGELIEVSHFVMYRGNFTGQADAGEPLPSGEFEELEFTATPDGGLIPKGTIIAFTGGTRCPPGWREVVGYPGDSDSPGNVLWETTSFKFKEMSYDASKDVTTLLFDDEELPLSVSSQDEFSSYPWASARVLAEIVKRDPPPAPRYKFSIKVDGIRVTLLDTALPSPPPRGPRFDYVNVGLLKPAIVPGMFFQLIRDKTTGSEGFVPENPFRPDAVYHSLIVGVRISREFVAYEEGSSADPTTTSPKSYPESYAGLATDLNIWSVMPSPLGIITAITTLSDLYNSIRAAALYDPRRTGEPLPSVRAAPVEGGSVLTYIDFKGDWREAFDEAGDDSIARIIQTGYLKMDADKPGFVELGAEEHNHRVEPSEDLTLLQPSNVYRPNIDLNENFPPVLAGHGHNYLGTGAYSRPRARVVKLCIKE